MEFVETQILPKYTEFGESHGLRHVNRVIKNSLELARITGADINMVYVVAAYHDLGMSGPRAIHHITSGKILMADARLKRWFSQDQIKIMKEAVEDHRASSSRQPRSIYGKIVAEGTPAQIRESKTPYVHQFVWGEADGPVPFHYPAPPYGASLLREVARA